MDSQKPPDPIPAPLDLNAPRQTQGQRRRAHLRLISGRNGRHESRRHRPAQPEPFVLGRDAGGFPCILESAARARHLCITGMPGAGKSTLLLNLVHHDLRSKTGCLLLDPHGGLSDDILASYCGDPTDLERVVVVDAADAEHPVGIDLLNARTEYEQDLVVQFFLGLFAHLYLAEHQGPIFHQAMRNGLLLLMTTGRSLAEFPLVFTDKRYLDGLLRSCPDPFVRRYFEKVWKNTADFHKSESLAYFTSKFSPFFEDRLTRNILAQRGGGLDLDAVLAEGKVVLVNLARGRIGDANASLLGQILLHLVRRAAMRRNPTDTPPLFNLYVDEAHEFAGAELRELVTAMRKFALGVTLANQSIDDFHPRVRDTLLGSVGTFVILRQGPETPLDVLTEPRFDRSDLGRLPDYHAVVCRSAGECYVPPAAIRLSSPPRSRRAEQAAAVRQISARRYGRPRAAVEAALLRVVDGGSTGGDC
jgi:hypothetical protein